ncbi:unnamed protein product [Cylicostephanus goldi]|uniref:Uncharacterized protein n=1 Tax=Cylicostephanus goldi TaxID=71465 RepID=A0A3P6V1U7_CYLGO|nr:unnamed protein product [Cylicostephanus goldi]
MLESQVTATVGFNPQYEGCHASWKAYSSDQRINDRERELVIETLPMNAFYFCKYEEVAYKIRNLLKAYNGIPSSELARAAKASLEFYEDSYGVEVIATPSTLELAQKLEKIKDEHVFVACALSKDPLPSPPQQKRKKGKFHKNKKKQPHKKHNRKKPTKKNPTKKRTKKFRAKRVQRSPPSKKLKRKSKQIKHQKKKKGSPSKILPPNQQTNNKNYYICVYNDIKYTPPIPYDK